ncbi:hypothetical protein Avbf_13376 [Armadillidium vulgare]|nr:hypothetical protein Avbf_13376 [Armadillidium vulgare]
MTLASKMGTLPEDIDRDVAGATSVLVQRANEIRQENIPWPSYLQKTNHVFQSFKFTRRRTKKVCGVHS